VGSGVNAMTLESSGEILLAGAGPSATLLSTAGAIDPAFGKRGMAFATIGVKGSANGVTVQPDGKIVLTGATNLSGFVVMAVARINP
jgi:hypothetical protein